jgi:hypothetical protein
VSVYLGVASNSWQIHGIGSLDGGLSACALLLILVGSIVTTGRRLLRTASILRRGAE